MKRIFLLGAMIIADMNTAQAATVPTFESVQSTHDVTVNTDAQSAFWRGAKPIYLERDSWGQAVPHLRTKVLSRWTKDNLYILFICPYRKLNLRPNPHPKTETNQLWNWDVAEIFIGWSFHDIFQYKEFEISPQGEWVDLDIDLKRKHESHDWTWNSGFQVTARIDRRKKIWYGAMRIPFAAIDPYTAKAGSLFRVNLFRTEGAAPNTKEVVWQPTMSKTFHVPERFGQLKLLENP